MRFCSDPLEEWAIHCHRRGASISLDSSGATTPGPEEFRLKVDDIGDEAEAEAKLREELCRAYGVDGDMIALTMGAQHADFLFFFSHLSVRDTAAVESPTFMPIRRLAEAVSRVVSLERSPAKGYVPDALDLSERLRSGAKVVALTNLHNPSGALLGDEVLSGIVDEAERRGALVLVDEVFREMSYGPVPKGAYQLGESGVSVSSVTKLNGLRGLRVGWLLGPPPVARAVEAARMYTSYRLPVWSCRHAAEAVRRREWFRERALRRARENLPALEDWLRTETRVSCHPPQGGLMAHVILPQGIDDLELSERLLDNGVAVGPGRYWGAPGTIRITFSCPRAQLKVGLDHISDALDLMMGRG